MTQIKSAIRSMVKSMTKPDLMIGKVLEVNPTDWTIKVELNIGAIVETVTIKSVLGGSNNGIYIQPAYGSYVLVGMTDGKLENLTVLVYDQIEVIKLLPSFEMQLFGDQYGGLVQLYPLQNNLTYIVNAIEELKSAISNGFGAIGEGGAASGTVAQTLFNYLSNSVNINLEYMENTNVKHG